MNPNITTLARLKPLGFVALTPTYENRRGNMNYRRAKTEGGTYFFTVTLADRRKSALVEHVDLLRSAIRLVKERHPFTIDAIVIMPEHLHTIWTLPKGDKDYPTRWALIKAGFSRALPKGEAISESRLAKGERGIWQRRYRSIKFVMTRILHDMLITSISTR